MQFNFTPAKGSESFIEELRKEYPYMAASKLCRAVFVLGQQVVEQEPKRLLQVIQEERRTP